MADRVALTTVEELLQQGNTAEALDLLEKYLHDHPRDLDAWWLAACHVQNQGKLVVCLKRVLSIDPNHIMARARLAELEQIHRLAPRKASAVPSVGGEQPDDEIIVIDDLGDDLAGLDVVSTPERTARKAADSLPDVQPIRSRKKNRRSPGDDSAAEATVSADKAAVPVWLLTFTGLQSLLLLCTVVSLLLIWRQSSESDTQLESGLQETLQATQQNARNLTETTKNLTAEISGVSSTLDRQTRLLQEQTTTMTALGNGQTTIEKQVSALSAEVPRMHQQVATFEREIAEAEKARNQALASVDRLQMELALKFETRPEGSSTDSVTGEDVGDNPTAVAAKGPEKESAPGVESSFPAAKMDAQGDFRIPLPHAIVDMLPADGGRFLVLKVETFAGLLIVDTVHRRLAGSLRFPSEDFLFSAGGNKILVYFKENGLLQVYDLRTRKVLKTKPNPKGAIVTNLVMGHSNEEFALVRSAVGTSALDSAGCYLLDLKSLEPVAPPPQAMEQGRRNATFSITGHNSSYRDFVHFRTNGDLTLVSEWCTSHSPTGVGLLRIKGATAEARYDHTSAGTLVVGDDGRVYASSGAIYNSQLTQIGSSRTGINFPGLGGGFFLSIGREGPPQVFQSGSSKPVVTLDPISDIGLSNDPWTRSAFTMDRRVVFAPLLGYLAVLPSSNEEIVIRPFDLDRILARSKVDYLIVTSTPPVKVSPGKAWNYQVEVIQNQPSPLKYELQAAPAGMQVSETGRISWRIPAELDKPESVILLISNDKYDSTFHSFEIIPE